MRSVEVWLEMWEVTPWGNPRRPRSRLRRLYWTPPLDRCWGWWPLTQKLRQWRRSYRYAASRYEAFLCRKKLCQINAFWGVLSTICYELFFSFKICFPIPKLLCQEYANAVLNVDDGSLCVCLSCMFLLPNLRSHSSINFSFSVAYMLLSLNRFALNPYVKRNVFFSLSWSCFFRMFFFCLVSFYCFFFLFKVFFD